MRVNLHEMGDRVMFFVRVNSYEGNKEMTEVSIVGPDGGDVVLSGPTRMRIIEDGSHTEHRLGLGEITIAPHTDGPPQHRHAQHDEGFYVLSGAARFTVGDRTYDAGPGTFVLHAKDKLPEPIPNMLWNPFKD